MATATIERVPPLKPRRWKNPLPAAAPTSTFAGGFVCSAEAMATHDRPFHCQLPSREIADTHCWLSQYLLPSGESCPSLCTLRWPSERCALEIVLRYWHHVRSSELGPNKSRNGCGPRGRAPG
jgi:hypothetical protein